MALVLDFTVCQKNACRTIAFTELTGEYSAVLNDTGWGSPNATLGSVTARSIVITKPDGTTTTITSPNGLPNDETNLEYEISAATLDSTQTKVLDGLYTFVYSVTAGETTYTATKYVLFTCNLECCVAKLFAKIATDNDCACNSTVVKNALYADALLQGLLGAKSCGNVTAINSLLTKLNKICTASTEDCGCS